MILIVVVLKMENKIRNTFAVWLSQVDSMPSLEIYQPPNQCLLSLALCGSHKTGYPQKIILYCILFEHTADVVRDKQINKKIKKKELMLVLLLVILSSH